MEFRNDSPIYLQLVQVIERSILTGQYISGQKLPSVREFASIYQVNPNTIQKALQELQKKGLIYTERTNGKFVSKDVSLIDAVRNEYAQKIVDTCLQDLQEIGLSKQEALSYLK